MDSGLCTAEWFRWAEAGIFAFAAALAAIMMVLTAAWVAPSHRGQTAALVFSGGFVLAGYLGWATNAWVPFAAATMGGAIALWFVLRTKRTLSSS